jgi:hypothetical protein
MASNSCCNIDEVEMVRDYSTSLGSAIPFLERAGVIPVLRGPMPRIQPSTLKVHRAPVQAPLPLPEFQYVFDGANPPDRTETYDWPHPDLSEEPE